MTAIVGWKQDNPGVGVHIATDSLWLWEGRSHFVPKVITLPHLRAVIAVQGVHVAAAAMVQEIAKRAGDLRRVVEIFPSLVHSVRSLLDADGVMAPGASAEFVMVLGGIDGDDRAHLIMCATDSGFGLPAFQCVDAANFVALPGSAAILHDMQLPADTDEIRPHDAVRFVSAQRRGDILTLDGKPAHEIIGGDVVWTGIYPDRIEQRVVGQITEVNYGR